jgi:CO/xanthine dehydrogenase Mo-binding subunit
MRRGGESRAQHPRHQIEGAIAMGIGGALFEEIEFRPEQGNHQ